MILNLIQIGLPIALILIMAGVGLGLTPEDFRRVFRQPRGFFIGALCQMALLPLIAIAIIEISGLHGEVAIGLFILSLCPGGTTSNLYSYLAKADTGLSVSLTAVIGFVTPFTIPLLTVWAINHYADGGTHFELPLVKTWLQLIVITVIPVIVGMAIRAKWPHFAKRMEPVISRFSVAVLAIVIAVIAFKLGGRLVDYVLIAGPAALALNLSTMLLGYLAGRWLLHSQKQARTISLEVGLQNGTLALLITTGILQSAEMSIAPSVYSLVMFITATLFTWAVLRKDRRNGAAAAAV
ncbi:MAG: Na+-dependent transporter [Oceanospirillaceae bacterium]|uniref:bile acid:sodium symporter family protein n=1 Tax=unclassified Thalassolituus TaxID=2624967 RepID=UPI000C57E249|nr:MULTISPECIES: bile acid:sodium symporter family protein [unclassified Thalassolituus]MBL35556.1 Na+-dependent transporter [Oceanospirillaceae bacterium]MBS51153.1 Na+-dependent transporter [Oceanospirillaceae bacterium]